MRHLYLLSTATILLGMAVVLAGAFGLLSGLWLIGGIGLVLAGTAKAVVFATWNGLAA